MTAQHKAEALATPPNTFKDFGVMEPPYFPEMRWGFLIQKRGMVTVPLRNCTNMAEKRGLSIIEHALINSTCQVVNCKIIYLTVSVFIPISGHVFPSKSAIKKCPSNTTGYRRTSWKLSVGNLGKCQLTGKVWQLETFKIGAIVK